MRTSILLIFIAAVFVVGGVTLWLWRTTPSGYDFEEEQVVRSIVTDFGRRINSVSLLAPDKAVRRQIREAYAPFVSEELLAAWLAQPANAPGRLTSSPWPDRIEITRVRKVNDTYSVDGTIVLMTSVELLSANEDNAGERPVTLTLAEFDGKWRITEFRMQQDQNSSNESYIAPDNAFALQYPRASFSVFRAGDEASLRAGHNIPPCKDGFAVCLVYSAGEFADTNFDSAGLGIFVIGGTNRADCAATEHGSMRRNVRAENIGGREFTVFESGSAAMSHVARDTVYLAWREDACYMLVARIAYSRFEVYEPGTIEEFTDESKRELEQLLHRVVSTFEFSRARARA